MLVHYGASGVGVWKRERDIIMISTAFNGSVWQSEEKLLIFGCPKRANKKKYLETLALEWQIYTMTQNLDCEYLPACGKKIQ